MIRVAPRRGYRSDADVDREADKRKRLADPLLLKFC